MASDEELLGEERDLLNWKFKKVKMDGDIEASIFKKSVSYKNVFLV